MTDYWVPDIPPTAGVKYQAIADALGDAIERGDLRGGDRLPPQRELAARLGIDLTTVTRAYETARQRGLIEPRGRAGSFVRMPRPVSPRELAQVDAGMNAPPDLPGNILARHLAETSGKLLLGDAIQTLQYQQAGGTSWDRAAGARMLMEQGLPADEQQIVITAGGQNALHAILAANFQAGDRIACGAHVYPGFRALAERLKIDLVPLSEMTADALRTAMSDGEIRALYVVPTNDNPTAVTLAFSERQALARLASERDMQIIEDDAYGALASDALAPIASLAPDRSWYIASTSKLISPALRVAYVRAPSIGAALRLAADVHETTIMAAPLNVAIVGDWIRSGTFVRLLAAMRAETRRRQSLARELLDGLDHHGHPDGYHLWLRLPAPIDGAATAELAHRTGLTLIPSGRFAVKPGHEQAMRVSLGGHLDLETLASGLKLLKAYLTDERAVR